MITRTSLRWPLAALALVLASCASPGPPAKRYPMQGEVKALNAKDKTATIAAGKIDDWMEAMTMEYQVKPDSDFQKLHVGDHIQGTVVVHDPSYYVTDVKVVAPPQP